MKTEIREQIYRDLETGKVGQIRYEFDDGSVEWLRPDGSYWDGPLHEPSSRQIRSGNSGITNRSSESEKRLA